MALEDDPGGLSWKSPALGQLPSGARESSVLHELGVSESTAPTLKNVFKRHTRKTASYAKGLLAPPLWGVWSADGLQRAAPSGPAAPGGSGPPPKVMPFPHPPRSGGGRDPPMGNTCSRP